MSQLSRVAKHLRRNTEYPGISVAQLAARARVPTDSVYRRVYDLRTEENKTIFTNVRDGKTFYRLAA
ncbi:MAG: hypothetical protein WD512_00925 [Candidatus Paceibacterota bacterium]